MLDQNTIIDAPLDEEPVYKQPYLMANRWDYFFNLFLISIIAILGIVFILPGFDDDMLIFVALLFFFLGVYQVLSCLVGIFRKNRAKKNYGILVIIYGLFSFVILSTLDNLVGKTGLFVFLFFIPGLMAVYYTRLCYLAYQKAKSLQAMSSSTPETT